VRRVQLLLQLKPTGTDEGLHTSGPGPEVETYIGDKGGPEESTGIITIGQR
jgi:hypothetical protein